MMIKNLNHLGVMLAVAAGTLVAGGVLLLMLVVVVEPAGAAFPVQNGKIAFVRSSGGFDKEIYTVNANGTGDPVRLTNNSASDSGPVWSPDCCTPIPGGNQIAFASDREGQYDIYTMNPTLATQLGPLGLIFIPTDRLTNNSAWDSQPAWSPDGNKIAFASTRDEGQLSPTGECVKPLSCNWNIYTKNANGTGDLRRLTNNTLGDIEPAWSPDGNKIAFLSIVPGCSFAGHYQIFTMNANRTGDPVPLTPRCAHEIDPAWSPDGNKIAFSSDRDGQYDIYTKNADGTGDPVPLANNIHPNAQDLQPAWSPDGNKIAFTSSYCTIQGDCYRDIYTRNADGTGDPVPLTNSSEDDSEPAWQPLRQTPVLPHRQLQP